MVNHSSSSDQAPLALARKKRGWTQAYVAEQVDVSIDAVRRWESGRIPYPSSIQKLCRLFAMSPQELGLFQDPHQRMATQAWRPDEAEKQAAWEIHVELVTRVPMTILEDDRGLLHEALTSFYSLFQTTRIILRQLGPFQTPPDAEPERSVSFLAVRMLNLALRPFLSKWHPLLKDYEDRRPMTVGVLEHERRWEQYDKLRQEMITLRPTLLGYADAFAAIAGTPSLITAMPAKE
ncbi:MAG TPA: helix-turn-helix transcriptional regulator [Ktedonosporobacter sp.]|jgi:transcriptional regulator with XRE-family HTH domain|nr:helix-turn-helix transcriptional regulator [Ktedonosporobacter sp.]